MSIRNQQIGWSQESKLWWEVLKQFNQLEQTIAGQYGKPLLVDNAQIGWRNEEYLLREIAKKIAAITALRCTDKCPPTTTSTTTPTPPCFPTIPRSFSFEVTGDAAYFDFRWEIIGAITYMQVDWGDGNPPEVISGVGSVFNVLPFITYNTYDTRTVTVNFDVCAADEPLAFYEMILRAVSDNPLFNSFNSGTVNFESIEINTQAPLLTLNISGCTELRKLIINPDYDIADPVLTTINTLDLSMSNVMETLNLYSCTINTLTLSPISVLIDVIIQNITPPDTILNYTLVAADSAGLPNGSFFYINSGVLDGAGTIAKGNLQANGWTVTPP